MPRLRLWVAAVLVSGSSLSAPGGVFAADSSERQTSAGVPTNTPAARVQEQFDAAFRSFQADTNSYEAAWKYARACFDLAEFARDDDQRALLANKGIRVCRRLVAREPGKVEGHYYLGMNLGQLARTKSLGALPIVDEMEDVFTRARALDERFDFAGADRNLGLLYLEAPAFASIGSRSKARQHLRRAAELASEYPENRLNLIEVYVRWSEYPRATQELKSVAEMWPKARERFSGPEWEASWRDWNSRLSRARQKIALHSTR